MQGLNHLEEQRIGSTIFGRHSSCRTLQPVNITFFSFKILGVQWDQVITVGTLSKQSVHPTFHLTVSLQVLLISIQTSLLFFCKRSSGFLLFYKFSKTFSHFVLLFLDHGSNRVIRVEYILKFFFTGVLQVYQQVEVGIQGFCVKTFCILFKSLIESSKLLFSSS